MVGIFSYSTKRRRAQIHHIRFAMEIAVPNAKPSITEPPPTKVSGFSVSGAPSAQHIINFRLKSEASNQFVESEGHYS
jgi:hypothetical protein